MPEHHRNRIASSGSRSDESGEQPRKRGDHHLLDASLAAFTRGLTEAGTPWMIVGGITRGRRMPA
jgi:hypothetical protein